MILIKRQTPDLAGEEQLIALFGAGLIGSAVARAIMQEGMRSAITLPFSWKDADRREADLASLREMMFGTMTRSVRHIEVVWTAGRAGFAAAWADFEEELAAFESVYSASACCCAIPAQVARHRFHMMSSAGGLFEGQRFVEKQTVPAPRRPYGHLKLEQELRANRLSAGHHPLHLSAELRLWRGHLRRPGRAHRYAHPRMLSSTALRASSDDWTPSAIMCW